MTIAASSSGLTNNLCYRQFLECYHFDATNELQAVSGKGDLPSILPDQPERIRNGNEADRKYQDRESDGEQDQIKAEVMTRGQIRQDKDQDLDHGIDNQTCQIGQSKIKTFRSDSRA